jgi:hypothetical protein
MKGHSFVRLACNHGRLTPHGARLRTALLRRRRAMHDEQVISGEVESPLMPGSLDQGGPVLVRNALAVLPLLGSPGFLPRLRQPAPDTPSEGAEQFVDSLHTDVMPRDNLSRQQGTPSPLTAPRTNRTIRPMGTRSVTPKAFKEMFCQRLRAARVLKYEQAADFARDLGIPANTYGKYESGRSLLPHHLIPLACELLDIEAKTLFQPERKAARKTGTG